MKGNDIPWLRIGAESAAIVVSILLAFAIDAWWSARLDRHAEQQLLSALVTEFEATLAELKERHDVVVARQQAAEALRKLDERSILQIDNVELRRLLSAARRPDRADPPTGVLNSAITSGKISLIQNQELAFRLAGWTEHLVDMRNTETDISTYLIMAYALDMAGKAVIPYEMDIPVDDSVRAAILDTSTKNHMNYIGTASGINAIENEQLQTEAQEILNMLRIVMDEVTN